MLSFGRLDAAALDRALADASAADFTYGERGATREPTLPPGYEHHERVAVIGRGDAAFARGVEGLRQWRAHAGIGARIHPATAPLAPGQTVVVVLGVGPLRVLAPCRVVHLIDEAERFGFAYGTLPGHPEHGEEMFMLERLPSGEVRFTIRVFSRPAELLTRVAGPVARLAQRLGTRGYARGLRRYVEGGTGEPG